MVPLDVEHMFWHDEPAGFSPDHAILGPWPVLSPCPPPNPPPHIAHKSLEMCILKRATHLDNECRNESKIGVKVIIRNWLTVQLKADGAIWATNDHQQSSSPEQLAVHLQLLFHQVQHHSIGATYMHAAHAYTNFARNTRPMCQNAFWCRFFVHQRVFQSPDFLAQTSGEQTGHTTQTFIPLNC